MDDAASSKVGAALVGGVARQVHSIMRHFDSNRMGRLSFEDFKRAFHVEGDEQEVLEACRGHVMDVSIDDNEIPQQPIPELHEEAAAQLAAASVVRLTAGRTADHNTDRLVGTCLVEKHEENSQ